MTRPGGLVLVLFLALLALGCGHSPSALYGTWHIDIGRQFGPSRGPQTAPSGSAMKDALGSGTFTFTDKTITTAVGGRTHVVDYKIITAHGDEWTLEAVGRSGRTEALTVKWTDSDHLVMGAPGKTPFYLAR
jgi:hypothetical protein